MLVKLAATLGLLAAAGRTVDACTMIAVGNKATADGSTLISHTNDAGLNPADLRLVRVPAMKHKPGSMRAVYNFQRNGYPRLVSNERGPIYSPVDDSQPLSTPIGYIPQVESTYGYFDQDYGLMNDVQLSIAESTCAARTAGWPKSRSYGYNLFQIEELSKIALERCDSARCAIKLMGDLAVEHGFFGEYGNNRVPKYSSSSEALGISDKYGEVWVFHILTGKNNASAVWAAQRVQDDHVSVVANSFVLRRLNLSDSENFMASDNVESFAQEMGWWDPAKGPFDFSAAYSWAKPGPSKPLYGGRRIWRVFDTFAPSLKLDSTLGSHPEVETYPFSVKSDKKITPRDVMDVMKDHYEGTEYDMTKDAAAGPFGNPIRYGGSTKGVTGGWERSISMHRTTHSFVLQTKSDVPDEVGGIAWYSMGAPHGSVFVPFSCAQTSVPNSYLSARKSKFDTTSAWWAFEFLNNWSLLRFNMINKDMQVEMNSVQDAADLLTAETQRQALAMPNSTERISYITNRNNEFADRVVQQWWSLAFSLIVKFSDGYIIRGEHTGDMSAPGYPAWWLKSTNFASWPANTYNPPSELSLQVKPTHTTFFVACGLVLVVAGAIAGYVVVKRHQRKCEYRQLE